MHPTPLCFPTADISLIDPVRLAYQSPVSCTFLSKKISYQSAVFFSHNKSASATSHQPNEQVVIDTWAEV
jgi:hypothetical protein